MSTVIKICGLHDPEIAKAPVELGAQYIGIMMYPDSKRYVSIDVATKISAAVKAVGGIPVAVFVDATAEQMQNQCEKIDVQTVQCHGGLSRSEHVLLPEPYQRIYVLHVNSDGVCQGDPDGGLVNLKKHRDFLLYDSMKGGSGESFSLKQFKHAYDFPFLLAGGLRADSVAEAIRLVRPFGVDVSSGVEISPGIKDLNLIKRFIEQVGEAAYE